jgi:hypothetical protein
MSEAFGGAIVRRKFPAGSITVSAPRLISTRRLESPMNLISDTNEPV